MSYRGVDHRSLSRSRDMTALMVVALILIGFGFHAGQAQLIEGLISLVQFELELLAALDRLPMVGKVFEFDLALTMTLESLNNGADASTLERALALKALCHRHLVGFVLSFNVCLVLALALLAKPRFTGALDLHDLDVFISRFYYPSRPVVGRNYQDRDVIADASARFAFKPWEFAIQHQLLELNGKPLKPKYAFGEINLSKPATEALQGLVYKPNLAARVFAQQLGPALKSPADVVQLPNEYKAVLVALLTDVSPEFARQGRPAHAWLKQFATSFWDLPKLRKRASVDQLPDLSIDNLDVRGVNHSLERALNLTEPKKLLARSAYANSLLAQLMNQSTLTSSKLLWLKPINRVLFYTLNNSGRPRRLFVEACAPHAHAELELAIERPLSVPRLENCVASLQQELERNGWLTNTA